MDKFSVGQKVRIIKADFYPELLGTVCTIIGQRQNFIAHSSGRNAYGYKTDLIHKGVRICPREHKIEPVYDGDEKSSWAECAWKPKEVNHHE